MTSEPRAGAPSVFACGVLRDRVGRILIVQLETDDQQQPLWWLPGSPLLPTVGAGETLQTFLTRELGLPRPRLYGQQLTSCGPTPGEPNGKLLVLFECSVVRDSQLDRQRLRASDLVHDALWATPEQVRTQLERDELNALQLALKHRPSGRYQHLQPGPAQNAAKTPPGAPRHSTADHNAGAGVLPGIRNAPAPGPALPRRVPKPPGTSLDARGQGDWFDEGQPP